MLIVGEEEEKKRNYFYTSSWTRRKGNITVTIKFAALVDEEIKTLKVFTV
jgi:hypothetical protein